MSEGLAYSPGGQGSTRSFNSAGQVAWRVTFTDRSTAIAVAPIP